MRRRRAELTADRAGLPATHRRRTSGPRREEVAERADISTALYARLEHGREVPVSRRTIGVVATALQSRPGEHDHLYALATNANIELHEIVSPALQRFVTSLTTHPARVLDRRGDVMLANRAARVIFHCGSELPSDLKAAPLALVERLRAAEPVFAHAWEEHRVRRSSGAIRQLDHPIAGLLSVEPSMYAVVESPGLRYYMVFTPTDAATARQIADLAERADCPC